LRGNRKTIVDKLSVGGAAFTSNMFQIKCSKAEAADVRSESSEDFVPSSPPSAVHKKLRSRNSKDEIAKAKNKNVRQVHHHCN
jgi:hypothetical protein